MSDEPALTLYYSSRACSLACHIALEEAALPFTAREIPIRAGAHKEPSYREVNPWGKIPALRVGDQVLTEAHAILTFIADRVPDQQLLPNPGTLARARAHEWMNFLSSTVHIAFRPLFRTAVLAGADGPHEVIKRVGIPVLRETLSEVDRRLIGRRWALGDNYSLCDTYLLVFWIWSQREDVIEHAQLAKPCRSDIRPTGDAARPSERKVDSSQTQACLTSSQTGVVIFNDCSEF
jgi:glutathione S-transferase